MFRSNASAIDGLVKDACEGRPQSLNKLLLRRGGIPGPRPNQKLALTVARSLFAQGSKGQARLCAMRRLDKGSAPSGSAYPILPMVGVLGLGCEACAAKARDERIAVLDKLQQHADDPRREVRMAVEQALGLCLKEHPIDTMEGLQSWMDGYFHAELVLRAITEPSVLQNFDDVLLPLSRLQESFALAADAPRAHQRSQGYRALLKAMNVAFVELGKRFPHPITRWLEDNTAVATKDLLQTLNQSLDRLRSLGLRAGDVQAVHDALDAAISPPRDPRCDVGPTRERGRKARKRGRIKR